MNKRSGSIFMILALVFFLAANPMQTAAAGLSQAVPLNVFLAAWIDLFFYIFSVIFLALGLSNIKF